MTNYVEIVHSIWYDKIVYVYVIVITCMGMSALPDMYICMPEARGLRAYISGKARVPMLFYISGTFKICLNLDCISSLYSIKIM